MRVLEYYLIMESINARIIGLTTIYEELNDRFSTDHCDIDEYQCIGHKVYAELFQKLEDIKFENLILDMVKADANITILNRLRELLHENKSIYNKKKEVFESFNARELFEIDIENKFGNELATLYDDKKIISSESYPSENERKNLLAENQSEIRALLIEKDKYRYTTAERFLKNYYTLIFELSNKYTSIINSYFPVEDKKATNENDQISHKEYYTEQIEDISVAKTEITPESTPTITPDMIFKTGMFEKLGDLETRLIKDGYLSEDLEWISKHKNNTSNIQGLVTFLTALIDKQYFMGNRDPKIKSFFDSRYNVFIGQNFEKKRRESITPDYTVVFYDYPF